MKNLPPAAGLVGGAVLGYRAVTHTKGDLIYRARGQQAPWGFEVDRSNLTNGLGVTVRVGERARVRVTAEWVRRSGQAPI